MKNGKWKAKTGMGTDGTVEEVLNLKSCRKGLPQAREPNHPAHFQTGDWTILFLSRNIIITYPAKLFIKWETRTKKKFLNTQGLRKRREMASTEFEERKYSYYSLREKRGKWLDKKSLV